MAPQGQTSASPLAVFSPSTGWMERLGFVENRLAEAEHQLKVAMAANSHLVSEAAKAEREAATARKVALVLRNHHVNCSTMADEQKWDEVLDLQDKLQVRETELTKLRVEKEQLQKDRDGKDEELKAQGLAVAGLEKTNKGLQQDLSSEKEKLEQQQKDAADIRANLDNAYAELKRKDDDHRALRKQRDEKEAELYDAHLQLNDAHAHFQQSQERVEELESQKSAVEALEQDYATLQAENDVMQETLDEQNRTVLVKDARIAHLEIQYQKALAAASRAEDKANAAAAPIDETSTSVDISHGASLADEIDNASDVSDADQLFQPTPDENDLAELEPSLELCALSNIATIVDSAPVAATTTASFTQTETQQPDLEFTVSAAADIPPVESSITPSDVRNLWENKIEPVLREFSTPSKHTIDFILERVQDLTKATRTVSSTQTEDEQKGAEVLSISLSEAANIAPVVPQQSLSTVTTQTDLPKLEQSVTSTILDYPPVVHEERRTQAEVSRLITTDQDTQTDYQPSLSPVVVHKKRSYFSLSTAMAIFFAILSILYYAELESWKASNNRIGVNRLYNSMGYKRRGRHIFGTIPVCYEQGEMWLTEALCQQFAAGIQKAEAWAGISYPQRW